MQIKVGINGFGRIGRVLTRILHHKKNFKIVAINEIDEDVKNLAYLLKYDSQYGRFNQKVLSAKNTITINKNIIKIFNFKRIHEVPWKQNSVDIVIDASGATSNVKLAGKIINSGIKKIIITHSPDKNIDLTMIMGVNEKDYNYKKHNIISSSICDASALAPVINAIENFWGIESGFVTTLHSRLSYQNLLDGSVRSISSPGHRWNDYSLGRNSIASLIPKKTTAIQAVCKTIPHLKDKLSGLSYRIPTAIVCGSDITIKIKKNTDLKKVKNFFKLFEKRNKKIFEYQTEQLVSIDHLKTTKSVILDSNYLDVVNGNLLKLIVWYDNEWGYANRVIDILDYISKKK
jgi:glyceraldehyde 3-phosphate dehydrogenase